MRATLLALTFVVAAWAAAEERKPPVADDSVRSRAEEAMRAYRNADRDAETSAPAVPIDAATADALAEIENLLSEAEAFIKTPEFALKAGDCFVAASQQLRELTAEQRQALGARCGRASARVLALGKALATSASLVPPGVDPKDPGAEAQPPALQTPPVVAPERPGSS